MGWCPVSPINDCKDDEACNDCLPFMCVCDECHDARHVETDGWIMGIDGKIYCSQCARQLTIKQAE